MKYLFLKAGEEKEERRPGGILLSIRFLCLTAACCIFSWLATYRRGICMAMADRVARGVSRSIWSHEWPVFATSSKGDSSDDKRLLVSDMISSTGAASNTESWLMTESTLGVGGSTPRVVVACGEELE